MTETNTVTIPRSLAEHILHELITARGLFVTDLPDEVKCLCTDTARLDQITWELDDPHELVVQLHAILKDSKP